MSPDKEQELAHLAGQAMAHAIYPFTWGLVQNSFAGEEGKELGCGVSIQWQGSFLILTAAHVVEKTPEDQLYYFPPADNLQMVTSLDDLEPEKLRHVERMMLAKPKVTLLDASGDLDLAAIRLSKQRPDYAERNFYSLDYGHSSPALGRSVAYLGYPGAKVIPYGKNFAISPFHAFGTVIVGDTCPHDDGQLAMSYQPGREVHPAGLSGSGIWFASEPAVEGKLWAPRVRLGGIITNYCAADSVLIGYRIETVIAFLRSIDRHLPF